MRRKAKDILDIANSSNIPIHITHQNTTKAIVIGEKTYRDLWENISSMADIINGFNKEKENAISNNDLLNAVGLLSQNMRSIENSYIELLLAVSAAMEIHQSYHYGHNERVALLASETARLLGCNNTTIENIRWASLLHDIGEITIPAYVLQKTTDLSEDEWEAIKKHPIVGAEIVGKVKSLESVAHIIYTHHERYDGSGYPEGLRGESIPLEARILSVADSYDAMTNLRLHRESNNHHQAIEDLKTNSGNIYDPSIVEVFLSLF